MYPDLAPSRKTVETSQLDHTIHTSRSVKWSPPAVTEVKLLSNHLIAAYSSQMAPQRNDHQWQVLEGRSDAAVPIWLGKQLWGLICPTPRQKRGCNSSGSWPTVLPLLLELQCKPLFKKLHWGNVPKSGPLSERHAGCVTPTVLAPPASSHPLFFFSSLHRSSFIQLSIRGHVGVI